jgi:hypothetical protein
MTRRDFGSVLAYMNTVVGKPLTAAQVEVYFDLLGDLPLAALQIAAKRAVLESPFPAMPTVGTLRKLATEAIAGQRPTAGEAWQLVMEAVRCYPWREPIMHVANGEWRQRGDHSVEGLASLPDGVARAARCLGWQALCTMRNRETMFAQFRDVYEDLQVRTQRDDLMPGALRQQIEHLRSNGSQQLAAKCECLVEALAAIGKGDTIGDQPTVRRHGIDLSATAPEPAE